MRYPFWHDWDPDWVEGLAEAFGIPAGALGVILQLRSDKKARALDSQAIFTLSWHQRVRAGEWYWTSQNHVRDAQQLVNQNPLSQAVIRIENSGSRIAVNAEIEIAYADGKKDFLRKTVVHTNEAFIILPDAYFQTANMYSSMRFISIRYTSDTGKRFIITWPATEGRAFIYDNKTRLVDDFNTSDADVENQSPTLVRKFQKTPASPIFPTKSGQSHE
ncbi:hypothetical protein [Levilactobacillus bambusae]|nr:hypothetical protein [Levilactobacillus bambusae]